MELTTFGFGVSDKKSNKINVRNLAETRIIHTGSFSTWMDYPMRSECLLS